MPVRSGANITIDQLQRLSRGVLAAIFNDPANGSAVLDDGPVPQSRIRSGVDQFDAEIVCVAGALLCCAAAVHSNDNLISVSRCPGSLACSAAFMLSCANHSNTLAMSIGPQHGAQAPQRSLNATAV
jgi:hypothetical protein